MIWVICVLIVFVVIVFVVSCGDGDSQVLVKFGFYMGLLVMQIIVKKSECKMYLVVGKDVVCSYKINLGNQFLGVKQFEGDGKMFEGSYFIDRKNFYSCYYLLVGIFYLLVQDVVCVVKVGLWLGGDIMIYGFGFDGCLLNWVDWMVGCIVVIDEEIEEIFLMIDIGVLVFIYF